MTGEEELVDTGIKMPVKDMLMGEYDCPEGVYGALVFKSTRRMES